MPWTQAQGGISLAEIADAEATLGVRFPSLLREYLSLFGQLTLPGRTLFGLDAQVPRFLHLVEMTLIERTEPGRPVPSHLVPLDNNGGGDLYCVDTRDDDGRIVYWSHEDEDDEPMVFYPSLAAWLDELVREADQST